MMTLLVTETVPWYLHGMSMSLSRGHLPSWANVLFLDSVWAHVPFIILYEPEFTMLKNNNIVIVLIKTCNYFL